LSSLSAADAISAATYFCAHLKYVALLNALMAATKPKIQTMLLRSRACHDIAASRVVMALYSNTHSASGTATTSAKTAVSSLSVSRPKYRPRFDVTTALRNLPGRIIRDFFEGMARIMLT